MDDAVGEGDLVFKVTNKELNLENFGNLLREGKGGKISVPESLPEVKIEESSK